MYQKITCAECKRTIIEFLGDSWIEEGWVACKCGYETRVNKAIPSNESRCISTQKVDQSSHNKYSAHAHRVPESTPL